VRPLDKGSTLLLLTCDCKHILPWLPVCLRKDFPNFFAWLSSEILHLCFLPPSHLRLKVWVTACEFYVSYYLFWFYFICSLFGPGIWTLGWALYLQNRHSTTWTMPLVPFLTIWCKRLVYKKFCFAHYFISGAGHIAESWWMLGNICWMNK
jgi:hypothetical protein